MVTVASSLFSSSSLRTARAMWRGLSVVLGLGGDLGRELKQLGRAVLDGGGEVHCRRLRHAFCEAAALQVATDGARGELEAGLLRGEALRLAGLGLLTGPM